MSRPAHGFLFVIAMTFSAFVYMPAWSDTVESTAKENAIQAELVRVDDRQIHVKVGGEEFRIPTAKLHSYRVRQGQLHLRLAGGRVLVVRRPGDLLEETTGWVELPRNPLQKGSSDHRQRPPSKHPSAAQDEGNKLLGEIGAQRRVYRKLRGEHKTRMHRWFSALEKAKRDGDKSSALASARLFETRRLADAVEKKLTSQRAELHRLEQLVRQAVRSGGTTAAVDRCDKALRQFHKQHKALAALAEELDQNLLQNYRALRGY